MRRNRTEVDAVSDASGTTTEAANTKAEAKRKASTARSERFNRMGRQALVIAGVVVLALVMMNLNSRLSEYYRLSAERDQMATRVFILMGTKEALETQKAYSESDVAAEEYARDARMIREGEKLIIPLTPEGYVTPTPEVPVSTPQPIQNWEVWWALFFQR